VARVLEHVPSKLEALSSNSSTANKPGSTNDYIIKYLGIPLQLRLPDRIWTLAERRWEKPSGEWDSGQVRREL
jgi:hypothetical protein